MSKTAVPTKRRRAVRLVILVIAVELAVLAYFALARSDLNALNLDNLENNAPAKISASNSPAPTRTSNVKAASASPTTTPTTASSKANATTDANANPISIETPTLAPIATLAPTAAPVPASSGGSTTVIRVPAGVPQIGTRPQATSISIPAINVRAKVVEMGWLIKEENGQSFAEWQVPDSDVGHSIGSANPGEPGNVVLSGHNNLFAAVFRKLYTLKPGDDITLANAAGQSFLYRVTQAFIVPERDATYEQRLENAKVLLPTTDARVTLISCWPETNNTHRAIVIAELVGLIK